MKTLTQALFLLTFLLTLLSMPLSDLHASMPIVINVSAGDSSVDYLGTPPEWFDTSQATFLPDKTRYFENNNTHVQLYNRDVNQDQVRLTYRNVEINLASSLNYNSLMETLIKIRAARTFGALTIVLKSSVPIEQVKIRGKLGEFLNLKQFLAVAGADAVQVGNSPEQKITEVKPTRNRVNQPGYEIGGTNHPELLSEIAGLLRRDSVNPPFDQSETWLEGHQIYWLATTRNPVNDHFFETLAQVAWLHSRGASVHLITPYLPYARSDKPEFDVGATTQGRLAADLIESVGTQGITVIRAHAPQSLGFFKIHNIELTARQTIIDTLERENVDAIVSPDAGFQKDATKYQLELNQRYLSRGRAPAILVVMNKERDSDGKERIVGGTGLENITPKKDEPKKKLAIIDDETSSGGSLREVAEFIEKYQPGEIFGVVTHLAGPATKALKSNLIKSLIVTNTVPLNLQTSSKIRVQSVAGEIAHSIQSAENNR